MNKITESNRESCIRVLNEVFDNFDFDRVKKTMDALNWIWFNPRNNGEVPNIDVIKQTAADLLWRCANEDIDCLSTGGFRVEKDFEDGDDPWMRLSFEVADFDVTYSDLP